ncbi:hypothetical protein G6028_11290 [Dietzia cercidiphylli]|nr:hypothetical protein [Dietzia cercidiphylli]
MWARDRASGDPVFIEEGSAATVRSRAKAEWECIVPGCDAPISSRGGARRDHFFHLTAVDHPGESLNHLAAKAMLAQWATGCTVGRAVVREEQTVKNRDLYRRPDVLITRNGDGHRLALEVEYKWFSAEDWQRKQDDFDREGIACAWLLGHTGIAVDASAAKYSRGTPVRVPPLAWVLAQSGRDAVVVNPVTRQIGTLSGDPDLTTRLGERWRNAYLGVDDLNSCHLDPLRGVVTPTMQRIDAASAQRRQQEAIQRAREAAELRQREARSEKWAMIVQANEQTWDASPLKRAILQRWGKVPEALSESGDHPYGIHASPAHWHSALYEAHIHQRRRGHVFTVDDCWNTLNRHGIRANWDRGKRFKSLVIFLESLVDAGLIDRTGRSYQWQVLADLDQVAQLRAEAAREKMLRQQDRAEEKRQQRQAREKAIQDARRQANELREQHRRERAEHRQAWLNSDVCRELVARYGAVPECISWASTTLTSAIDADPALWRAHICLRLVQDAPAGMQITTGQALTVLSEAGITFPAEPDAVAAIDFYLNNLRQRDILQNPNGDRTVYTTTGRSLS